MKYFTQPEIIFLVGNLELPQKLLGLLTSLKSGGGQIDDDSADELRNLCLQQLDVLGFDEEYRLTQVGKTLDELVDRLFVG